MIRLFLEAEEKIKLNTDITKYNHNKRILTDAISCIVTETTDGIFDLDLIYPLNDEKNLSQYLSRGETVKCPISQTDIRGEQLFTIRKRTPNTKDNTITIYAQAKARRDLDLNIVLGMKTTGTQTRKQALQMLLDACVEPHNYIVGNLDTNTNTSINLGLNPTTGVVINFLDINGVSPRLGLLSESEDSLYKAYGGEIIYNNFELNMVDERGTDHNLLIKSGKNLEELQQDIDDTDLENFATAILPCSADGLYLPNSEIIYSPNVSILGKIFKEIVFDDVTAVDNSTEAINIVYAQLRERVQKKFDDGMDKLKINNTINFIQLANTEEYKDYATLERCEIGNNVTVRYYKHDDENIFIEAIGRVVKIKFNVLKNKIEEVEVGDRKKKSIVDTINNTNTAIKNTDAKTNINTDNIKKVKKSTSDLQVTMEARDNEIELSVTNLATNTTAKFVIQDGLIASKVSDSVYQSYITQTASQIASKVAKAEFGSYITQNYDSIVQAIKDATGTHQFILDGTGASVKNGGFKILDSNDNIVFRIDSEGIVNIDGGSMNNLSITETGVGSLFYTTLVNMEQIVCGELKPSRLTLNQNDFYLTDSGESGYTLRELIEKIIAE